MLLLGRITADDKRRRRPDDRTAAHVDRVRGKRDITTRGRGKRDRWHVCVNGETVILDVLDRTYDLLHVRQEPPRRIHHDDEILIGGDGGVCRPMDVVGGPGIDLDIEGD